MASNFFINYSLNMMELCYKTLGVAPTNYCINNSVGSIFTSGETVETLMADVNDFRLKNINIIGNWAVEGMPDFDEKKVLHFYEMTLETIRCQDDGMNEGATALKLTGLIDTMTMTRWSVAQDTFLYDILELDNMRISG